MIVSRFLDIICNLHPLIGILIIVPLNSILIFLIIKKIIIKQKDYEQTYRFDNFRNEKILQGLGVGVIVGFVAVAALYYVNKEYQMNKEYKEKSQRLGWKVF